jgi:hypothetical protein
MRHHLCSPRHQNASPLCVHQASPKCVTTCVNLASPKRLAVDGVRKGCAFPSGPKPSEAAPPLGLKTGRSPSVDKPIGKAEPFRTPAGVALRTEEVDHSERQAFPQTGGKAASVDLIADATADGTLTRSLAHFDEKAPKTTIIAPPCAKRATYQRSALNWVFGRIGQKPRCLFRPVPLARGSRGTKMGKNAHFCLSLSHAGALTLRQKSQNLRPMTEKMPKKPIFVPQCSTRARANWNKHRGFRHLLVKAVLTLRRADIPKLCGIC